MTIANCDICGQPVTHTEFTARGGKFMHVSCLFREWCERGAEIERLKTRVAELEEPDPGTEDET